MTFEEFKERILNEIESANEELDNVLNILDLRAGRTPFNVIKDYDIFLTSDLEDAWNFVKDAEEWYVDVYENYIGENHAMYTGFSVASWTE